MPTAGGYQKPGVSLSSKFESIKIESYEVGNYWGGIYGGMVVLPNGSNAFDFDFFQFWLEPMKFVKRKNGKFEV